MKIRFTLFLRTKSFVPDVHMQEFHR